MLMPFDHVDELVRAKMYVEDPSCFVWVNEKTVVWMSLGAAHLLVRIDDTWHCDCSYGKQSRFPCGHLRALEQLASRGFGPDASTQRKALPDLATLVHARHKDWDRKISPLPTHTTRR
jgi:hypothetical protein